MAIKLQDRNPLTNADHLTTIEGLEGYFSEFSKASFSVERPMFSDGLTTIKRPAASGSTTFGDITLGRVFDPEKDGSLIDWSYNARCALEAATVTARPVSRCNGIERRGDKAWVFTGCRIKNFETFDSMNTGEGSQVVHIRITLSVEQASWE